VKKNQLKRVNKSEIVRTSQTDTLKFTSGIRAIFQDSKGNYWFGVIRKELAIMMENKIFQQN
jgi:outer membrane scaffolding protein for murein synthesis (MipA/OmpV family)